MDSNRPLTVDEAKRMFEAQDEARTNREARDFSERGRNGRQIRSAKDALKFLFGGKAILTLRSLKTGARFTYRVREKGKEDPVYFVSVLSGPDNTGDYSYIGTIFSRSYFRWSDKSNVAPSAPSVMAIRWALDHLIQGDLPCTLEIWHEGRCGRCGRRLTVPESIDSGMGPECAGRL